MTAPGAGDTIYRFGAFELLVRRQLLIHSGSPVAAGSRALAILSCLVERSGTLVSKDELLAAAWPSTFVHESNLKVNVASLRRALAAHDPRQDYIRSVPGRGYRFVGPVRQESAPSITYASAVKCASLPSTASLVGRSAAIDAICHELQAHRFVTITGTGGVGKTAVALAVAHRVSDRFTQGACFVDLASVGDERHLAATISSELGIRSDSEDLLGAVAFALAGETRLLLLDNCEHLLPAIAAAAERLAAALPDATILATSREPLRLIREHVCRIAPLACPPSDAPPPGPEEALAFPAVELFAKRAWEATGTEIARVDLPAVVEICGRLDGIPLALELAAARCASSTPAEILQLLENRFDLLDEHDPVRTPRQRALRATLEWSYGFLRPHEAAILRALAIFAQAFTVDDALAIAQATQVAPVEALDAIVSLISKSLLSPDGREDGTRYRLLESTRAFATELLAADPRRSDVQARHAVHICSRLEAARGELPRALRADEQSDPSRLVAELRRALSWAFGEGGAASLGVRLTDAAIPVWQSLSLLDESIVHLTEAIEKCGACGSERGTIEIRLQTALATALFHTRGLTRPTEAALHRALEMSEELGQPDHLMSALWGCAVYELHAGKPGLTIERLGRFARLGRDQAHRSIVPDGERLLAAAEMYRGELASASARLQRVLQAGTGDGRQADRLMFQLPRQSAAGATYAMVKWLMGDRVGAAQLAEQTIQSAIAADHPVSICNAIVQHALTIALFDGRLDDANRYLALLREQLAGGRLRLWAQITRCAEAAFLMRQGEPDGVSRLQHTIIDVVAAGTPLRVPAFKGMLAETLVEKGRFAEASIVIEGALMRAREQQERWIIPELNRIEAAIRLRQGQPEQAEQSLQAAINFAQNIGAESWLQRARADRADPDCRHVPFCPPLLRSRRSHVSRPP